MMNSLPKDYRAVVAGSTGGIGAAVCEHLASDPNCSQVVGLSRSTNPSIDFRNEETIAEAADKVSQQGKIHLFFCATGILSQEDIVPEKSLREINPDHMAQVLFANTIGPALLMKHFCPLLSRSGRSFFAAISARVGSISDNNLGGWYSYRASKAALNMLVKGAAIEISRNRQNSICVGLHPGTVDTPLSKPFAGNRSVFEPEYSALKMLQVLDNLKQEDSGGLFAYDGQRIAW